MQDERGLGDDEAEDRDALYERADRVAAALASTGDELRDVICDVNQGDPQCTVPRCCGTAQLGSTSLDCLPDLLFTPSGAWSGAKLI